MRSFLLLLILFVGQFSLASPSVTKQLQGSYWYSSDLTKLWLPPASSSTLLGAGLASIVTGDISTGGVTSTNILDGTILNADVNASAAIALSKLATVTGNKALVSNGSGAVSASTVTDTELGYVGSVTAPIQTQLNDANRMSNYALAYSVGSNALTITLKDSGGSSSPSAASPAQFTFRSSTLSSGSAFVTSVTGALSTVISSGSTAGFTSAIAHPLYVGVLNNSGTVELCWSGTPWDESQLITTTAEGGAGAADSETTIYSTTARTSVPSRIIGKAIATESTAGTWTTAPATDAVGGIAEVRAFIPPTVQKFNSGVAQTYTLPTAPRKPLYIVVEAIGQGGGGGGSGTTAGTAATAGTTTTFGTSLITATGGGAGVAGGAGAAGGAGGSGTISSPAVTLVVTSGSIGGGGHGNPAGGTEALSGGSGGTSPYGGAGSSTPGVGGSAGAGNTGSGGGGGGTPNTASTTSGGGGGSGGYAKALISNPADSYTYTVGAAAGAAGGAGTSGATGGAGGTGVIIVTEYYQ